VLRAGQPRDEAMVKALQEHVKAEIAPFKYPRGVVFVDSLPRTGSGKLQRFRLRELARGRHERRESDRSVESVGSVRSPNSPARRLAGASGIRQRHGRQRPDRDDRRARRLG